MSRSEALPTPAIDAVSEFIYTPKRYKQL